MLHSLVIAGTVEIVVGCFAVAVADVFPAYRKVLRGLGGALFLVGVALFGLVFPMI